MSYLEICSNCGKKNHYGYIDGKKRYHCVSCQTIHYENPKPTSTIICIDQNKILLARRAFEPGKGEWGLPGGFMELNETLEEATKREFKEETNLECKFEEIISTCSHYGTIFGDILLICVKVSVPSFKNLKAGDDVSELHFFDFNNLPDIVFYCHKKFINDFQEFRK